VASFFVYGHFVRRKFFVKFFLQILKKFSRKKRIFVLIVEITIDKRPWLYLYLLYIALYAAGQKFLFFMRDLFFVGRRKEV